MKPNIKIPTNEEIKVFLDGYGWHYRETASTEGKAVIISPYILEKEKKGILISFRAEGEFIMVSTAGFLKNVPESFSKNLLVMNDRIKLVKLFIVDSSEAGTFDAELGFELWNESWNKETFYSFMDMLALGIERIIEKLAAENIPYKTGFVVYT